MQASFRLSKPPDSSRSIQIWVPVSRFRNLITYKLISIGIASKKAVKAHFSLLLAVMRVINAAVVSRGEQNEQTLTLGRRFLAENRLSILTVFKRSMNIGVNGAISSDELVDDLAESYILLITLTGFINVSDNIRTG